MSTMYTLRPLISNTEFPASSTKCMYTMKNIHGDTRQDFRIVSDVTEQVINFLKAPLPEAAALEKRQEKILGQLAELKEQVLNLCGVLRGNAEGSKTPESCPVQRAQREAVKLDVVLNVNPSRPSYSVLALEKLWSDVDFKIQQFTHSSVKSKIPENFQRSICVGNESVINVSSIWKNVSDTELVISSLHRQKILGEVNFLRYLGRLLGDYECGFPEEISKIDRILDLSHQLIHQEMPKDRQNLLNLLDQRIGKDWFLSSNKPGIADVAVWSAIKQISCKSLPTNLSKWFKKCDKHFT